MCGVTRALWMTAAWSRAGGPAAGAGPGRPAGRALRRRGGGPRGRGAPGARARGPGLVAVGTDSAAPPCSGPQSAAPPNAGGVVSPPGHLVRLWDDTDPLPHGGPHEVRTAHLHHARHDRPLQQRRARGESSEYFALRDVPGCLDGGQLEDVAPPPRCASTMAGRSPPTARSRRPRRSSPATTSSSWTTSTRRSRWPPVSRGAARRLGRGPAAGARLIRARCWTASSGAIGAAWLRPWSATSATSSSPRTPPRRRLPSRPSAGPPGHAGEPGGLARSRRHATARSTGSAASAPWRPRRACWNAKRPWRMT